jgi:hypothetical protein
MSIQKKSIIAQQCKTSICVTKKSVVVRFERTAFLLHHQCKHRRSPPKTPSKATAKILQNSMRKKIGQTTATLQQPPKSTQTIPATQPTKTTLPTDQLLAPVQAGDVRGGRNALKAGADPTAEFPEAVKVEAYALRRLSEAVCACSQSKRTKILYLGIFWCGGQNQLQRTCQSCLTFCKCYTTRPNSSWTQRMS